MEFTLTREQLDDLQKYGKLYTYLSQSFTKTYFVMGAGELSLFFQGSKGALKTTIEAPIENKEKRYFQADYNKWTNALSKLGFAPEVTFSLTEKFIKIQVKDSPDVINLGIIPCEKGSGQIEIIENTISSFKKEKEDSSDDIVLSDDLVQAISTATSMFSTVGKNNAIALTKDYVMYADRSIVLKILLSEKLPLPEQVILHKFTAGLFPFIHKSNPSISFADDYQCLMWEDQNGTELILKSEPCEINLPSEEELESITPQEEGAGFLEVPHTTLHNCLSFFNGFYEASVWKPITFRVIANKEASLYYKHPTTEITKDLETSGTKDGEFIVGSETLGKLISKVVDLVEEGNVSIVYDNESPGIFCNMASRYEVVFAKLSE